MQYLMRCFGPCSMMFKVCSVCLPTQLEMVRMCSAVRHLAAPSAFVEVLPCRAGQRSRSFLHLLGLTPAYELPVALTWARIDLALPGE